MYLRLFFVYSGAVSALLVPCPDPNRDPSAEFGAESAGSEKSPSAGAFPTGGACFSAHFLLLSDACHEAADFLCGFFFHTCCHMGIHVQ